MEVVLLWLDDLDDLVFIAVATWDRVRRSLLKLGFAASCALAGCELTTSAVAWIPLLTLVAAASVGCWLLGAALGLIYSRDPATDPRTA